MTVGKTRTGKILKRNLILSKNCALKYKINMGKKTFEEIHAEIKLEHGITGIEEINKFRITLPIAIERYANYKAAIAFDEGFNKGIKSINDAFKTNNND
jgi:hypothetical protein